MTCDLCYRSRYFFLIFFFSKYIYDIDIDIDICCDIPGYLRGLNLLGAAEKAVVIELSCFKKYTLINYTESPKSGI